MGGGDGFLMGALNIGIGIGIDIDVEEEEEEKNNAISCGVIVIFSLMGEKG